MGKSRKEELLMLLKEDPSDSFTKYALAMELMSEGDYDSAYQQYSEIITNDGSYLPVYYQMGKLCETLLKKEKAIDIYTKGMLLAQQQRKQHTLNELRSALEQLTEDDD